LEKQSRKETKGFYVLVLKPIWIKARSVFKRFSTRNVELFHSKTLFYPKGFLEANKKFNNRKHIGGKLKLKAYTFYQHKCNHIRKYVNSR